MSPGSGYTPLWEADASKPRQVVKEISVKKVVRTTVLSLVTTAFAFSGASTASAQDLGLALTGAPNLDNLAEKGLIRIDESTLSNLPGLNTVEPGLNAVQPSLTTVQQTGLPNLEGRAASEVASARGVVGGAVDKLPQLDTMDVSKFKAASVQNNSLVGPLNALCAPLADKANCSSTHMDKRLMGNIAHKDETLVGYGKSAF